VRPLPLRVTPPVADFLRRSSGYPFVAPSRVPSPPMMPVPSFYAKKPCLNYCETLCFFKGDFFACTCFVVGPPSPSPAPPINSFSIVITGFLHPINESRETSSIFFLVFFLLATSLRWLGFHLCCPPISFSLYCCSCERGWLPSVLLRVF